MCTYTFVVEQPEDDYGGDCSQAANEDNSEIEILDQFEWSPPEVQYWPAPNEDESPVDDYMGTGYGTQ